LSVFTCTIIVPFQWNSNIWLDADEWLPQFDAVLAFHSAQKQHGWVGATYVLLRKSEKKKLETWEMHNKR
jgi:hypothetical protein